MVRCELQDLFEDQLCRFQIPHFKKASPQAEERLFVIRNLLEQAVKAASRVCVAPLLEIQSRQQFQSIPILRLELEGALKGRFEFGDAVQLQGRGGQLNLHTGVRWLQPGRVEQLLVRLLILALLVEQTAQSDSSVERGRVESHCLTKGGGSSGQMALAEGRIRVPQEIVDRLC